MTKQKKGLRLSLVDKIPKEVVIPVFYTIDNNEILIDDEGMREMLEDELYALHAEFEGKPVKITKKGGKKL